MKAYGVDRKDKGCCPGHDKFPKEKYKNNKSKKAQSRDTKYAHGRQRMRNRLIEHQSLTKNGNMKENEYTNGWANCSVEEYENMYNTNTAQYPAFCICSNGSGFDAKATLKANGLDPQAIPSFLRSRSVSANMLDKINETIPLTYYDAPSFNPNP